MYIRKYSFSLSIMKIVYKTQIVKKKSAKNYNTFYTKIECKKGNFVTSIFWLVVSEKTFPGVESNVGIEQPLEDQWG